MMIIAGLFGIIAVYGWIVFVLNLVSSAGGFRIDYLQKQIPDKNRYRTKANKGDNQTIRHKPFFCSSTQNSNTTNYSSDSQNGKNDTNYNEYYYDYSDYLLGILLKPIVYIHKRIIKRLTTKCKQNQKDYTNGHNSSCAKGEK